MKQRLVAASPPLPPRSPAPGEPLCSGFWGKLPGHGDFVGRGLPHDWVRVWDGWLQRGLDGAAQARGTARLRTDLAQMPVWCFAARPAADTVPASTGLTWCGLLAPSRDRVGRAFPITLVQAWPGIDPSRFDAVGAHLEPLLALLPLAADPGAADALAAALSAITRPPQHLQYRQHRAHPAESDGGSAAAWPEPGAGGGSWWWRPAAHGKSAEPQQQPWPPEDTWLAHLLDRA